MKHTSSRRISSGKLWADPWRGRFAAIGGWLMVGSIGLWVWTLYLPSARHLNYPSCTGGQTQNCLLLQEARVEHKRIGYIFKGTHQRTLRLLVPGQSSSQSYTVNSFTYEQALVGKTLPVHMLNGRVVSIGTPYPSYVNETMPWTWRLLIFTVFSFGAFALLWMWIEMSITGVLTHRQILRHWLGWSALATAVTFTAAQFWNDWVGVALIGVVGVFAKAMEHRHSLPR